MAANISTQKTLHAARYGAANYAAQKGLVLSVRSLRSCERQGTSATQNRNERIVLLPQAELCRYHKTKLLSSAQGNELC